MHIVIIADEKIEFDRDMIQGIRQFSQTAAPLELMLESLSDPRRGRRRDWRIDGIIGHFTSEEALDRHADPRLPCIAVAGLSRSGMHRVTVDSEQVVELAFEHLVERGFRQLAFCGERHADFSTARAHHFLALADRANIPCSSYEGIVRRLWPSRWERELNQLTAWLTCLPKPMAVFCSNDERGQHVLDACRRAGLQVPEQVAVLGAGNHETLCTTSRPPLSSVDQNNAQLGFVAAQRMLQLLSKPSLPLPAVELVPPRGVIVRQSTNTVATDDLAVANASAFIRDHAHETIQVADVVAASGVSRRSLEMRFSKILGTSVRREIERHHVERARHLLLATDWPVHRIAQLCGFVDGRRLAIAFQTRIGQSPTEFRRTRRMG